MSRRRNEDIIAWLYIQTFLETLNNCIMTLYQNWRDCQEWRNCGLSLSTTSNEACKMYDASLTQLIAFTSDPSVGGIDGTMKRMLAADPDFVMGQVLVNGLTHVGMLKSVSLDKDYAERIDSMVKLADTSDLSQRERMHVSAVKALIYGDWSDATATWEEILLQYPTDALALNFCRNIYFYSGKTAQERDLLARAMHHYKPGVPLYEYIPGFYSFGLAQTYFSEKAEFYGKKGLELNSRDGWARHALGHVYEMSGRFEDGIKLYSSTEEQWTAANMISCHNYWHWAVYHVEKGDYQAALDLFDAEILQRASKVANIFNIADVSSLLYRLELEGVNVAARWQDVYEICKSHNEDHLFTFGDSHILMGLLGAHQEEATEIFMNSLKEFISTGKGHTHGVMKEVGMALMESLVAYNQEDYGKAVDLLTPVRYKVAGIGGSIAQLDVFNLFLISAALKSPVKDHNKFARCLLVERQAMKEESPMTDRLMSKMMALHVD